MKKLIILSFCILFFTLSGNAQTTKATQQKTAKTKNLVLLNKAKAKAKVRKLKVDLKKEGE